jgi:hypothetical protein
VRGIKRAPVPAGNPPQIIARTAAQLAAPLLRPALAAPAPESAGLAARLAAAAASGNGEEGAVDADEAALLLLEALEAQRAADAAQIEVGWAANVSIRRCSVAPVPPLMDRPMCCFMRSLAPNAQDVCLSAPRPRQS